MATESPLPAQPPSQRGGRLADAEAVPSAAVPSAAVQSAGAASKGAAGTGTLGGRIDILRAELARRREPGAPVAADGPSAEPAELVELLPKILADVPSRHRTSARHVTLGTPHSAEYERLAEEMLAEIGLSDLPARTDEELHGAMGRLEGYEQQVSRRRHGLQRTADQCSAEIARRYREGEAQVDDLLS
ncbi:putative AmfC protein [Streptomyces himastatinicus ATCC 53653]|uniref:Putative AmfC protein n=1 Tax=Streptomyces himastatinicus ATCC 53653 TaxID=457427 RepID=D9WU73_9ACTN|nr:hypothetical protein [Streptomyces himastatinicus]EFL24308.1 putative AmfC protein [Streptomyces himastatinicus ATCC 53653]